MQIHELKCKKKERKIVGRGGKRGTFSGKGSKGQSSRSGRRFEPVIRALIKRYPKLRGYRFKGMSDDIAVLNLESIEVKFKPSEIVSPQTLLEKGVVSQINGKTPKVKILSKGKITKSLIFEGCDFSKTAREKIEKAQGQIKEKNKTCGSKKLPKSLN
ncbi:50S ribosomal protein L15 [Candidatus Parcubacteria bacterium A4]|nr:MAG: 50S ribosomal protein L15 [Candidatus Parcubacteria bacterium A4]